MVIAWITFIGIFFIQLILLQILRKAVKVNIVFNQQQIFQENKSIDFPRKIDDLDIELFCRGFDFDIATASLKIKSENQYIDNLLKKQALVSTSLNNLFYCSLLYKSINILPPIGLNQENTKSSIIKLLSSQFTDGSAPAYLSQDKVICADDAVSSAAIVFAVTNYIDYSGDVDFLNEVINYGDSHLSEKSIKKWKQSAMVDSVYNHCVAALNYCKNNLNQHLLIRSNHLGVVAKIPLFNGYEDIAASLFYIISVQKFMPYIKSYEERTKLVFLLQQIYKNASNKLSSYSDLSNPEQSKNGFLNAVLFVLCQHRGDERQNIINKIVSLTVKDKLPREVFCDQTLLALTCVMLYKEHEIEAADKIFLRLATCANINCNILNLVKHLGVRCYFGLDFKNGYIVFKRKNIPFKLEFCYNNKVVKIVSQHDFKGLSVDGLIINNLDYINLKGYNKDIIVKLGTI